MKYKRYTKKDRIISTPEQLQPLLPALPLSALYHSTIADCPLDKFITVSTTGDLTALTVSGEPTPDQLRHAWGVIMEEYSEAIGDFETKQKFSLYKDIHRLTLTLNQISLIVSLLKTVYVPRFVTELNRLMRCTFIFNVHDREAYDKTLQMAINKSKGLKINLDLKTMQFEALLNKEDSPNGVISKQYFQSVLLTLKRHEGYV